MSYTPNRLIQLRAGLIVLVGFALAACAGRPAEVSPNEIPTLEAQLSQDPDNADVLLRYSAALFSAGRCDTASVVAASGAQRNASSAIAPLVIGQCLEQSSSFDDAVGVYQAFVDAFPDAPGADAVRARQLLALQSRAIARARNALAQEDQLGAQGGDPRTIAVLPIDVAGDSTYQPLGRGLAQIFIADLSLLQQFTLVERIQVQALVDEMRLAETGAVDPATAARMGRMLRAGRMVQGLANIPDEDDIRLDVSVVDDQGQIASPAARTGRLRQILRMEKEIVIEIAAQLGYQLSQAERQAIFDNGTRDLTAFLAYSRGLAAEDIGDYSAAATFYQQAVQADPNFQQARSQFRANAAAPSVQNATVGQVTTVSVATAPEPDFVDQTVGDAVTSSVADVAATTSEATAGASTTDTHTQTTQQATTVTTSQPNPTTVPIGITPTTIIGVIRIVFRLP